MPKMRLTIEADGPGFRRLSSKFDITSACDFATLLKSSLEEESLDLYQLGFSNLSVTIADSYGYLDAYSDTGEDSL